MRSRRCASAAAQMADGAKDSPEGDKLPRAHKRCINKECREVLTLATKVRGSGWAWAVGAAAAARLPPRQARCCRRVADTAATALPAHPQYCKKCNTQQFERRGSQKRGKGEDSGVRPLWRRRPDWPSCCCLSRSRPPACMQRNYAYRRMACTALFPPRCCWGPLCCLLELLPACTSAGAEGHPCRLLAAL